MSLLVAETISRFDGFTLWSEARRSVREMFSLWLETSPLFVGGFLYFLLETSTLFVRGTCSRCWEPSSFVPENCSWSEAISRLVAETNLSLVVDKSSLRWRIYLLLFR